MTFLEMVLSSNRKAKLTNWAKDAKPEDIADVLDRIGTHIEGSERYRPTFGRGDLTPQEIQDLKRSLAPLRKPVTECSTVDCDSNSLAAQVERQYKQRREELNKHRL